MNAGRLHSLANWLARPEVRTVDPERILALEQALHGPDPPVTVTRHGALICYDPAPGRRRLLQFDRGGLLFAALNWQPGGALRWAKCRIPDGRWVGVEPGAASHSAWGRSDQVWLLDPTGPFPPAEALTVFQSLDYERLDVIPPLAEPRRLLPGAGTSILNLLAGLMKDQGMARARYRGPYPTEQLFTALLECFRYDPEVDTPLERFMHGGALDWLPAPYEGHFVADAVYVQLRHEVDKVVVSDRAFYRPDWQGVLRREPRVVRVDGARRVCSLWALGRPLEDRLVLDPSGNVLAVPPARSDPRPPAPMRAEWSAALAALIAQESAPMLTEPIREVLSDLGLEWGAVPGDWLRIEARTIRITRHLDDAARAWILQASTGAEQAERAMAFAVEVARLLGPEVRARAQARLEALPEDEHVWRWEAVEAGPPRAPDQSVVRLLSLIMSPSPGSGAGEEASHS